MTRRDRRTDLDAELGSILLASPDPDRLRDWYVRCLGLDVTPDGFVQIGAVGVLFDQRDDVSGPNPEPGRLILNFHVADARAALETLRAEGATVEAEPEWRGQAWFATVLDPDGNRVQVIELSAEYYTSRGLAVPPRSLPDGASPLARGSVETRLPAQDLERARRWYADHLGLEPTEEREGGLRYSCGGTSFVIFQSSGSASGDHTQLGWKVDDLDAVVTYLRERGVALEEYDLPGLETVDGVVEIPGTYPSDGGRAERGAWFKDGEGNLIGVGEIVRD